ncbi:NUDIX hydrolase [Niveispirillum sp. KHB5.9]|uniref:NUDIX hydrolase n=1 Tax=Niveispirillum sp. KHB5.9 TaxID=3400269 RepID=UPI003A84D8CD
MSARKIQHAALPYRMTPTGPQILLVTSRETRRWIIPKGWAKKNVDPQDMAATEAFEEAGVRGKVKKKPVGSYEYDKRLDDGSCVTCDVSVYALEVTAELPDWPERTQRERRWLSPAEAVVLISEPGLVDIFQKLAVKWED